MRRVDGDRGWQSPIASYLIGRGEVHMLKKQLPSNSFPLPGIAGAIAIAAADAAERVGLADRVREFARRVRRAGMLFVVILSALIIFSLAVAPVPILLWLVAVPLAAMASMLSLMWPSRRRARRPSREEASLPQLARAARSSLKTARPNLFAQARDLAARIEAELRAVEESAAGTRLDALADAAVRRLLHDHLPRLLESYSRLPQAQKNDPETREHLCAGLRSVSRELEATRSLLDQGLADRFDTERRFFASRYPEPA